MNYPLFPSQAKDWIEIISSLSYNLLSYFVWLHVYSYVHMLTHTHTHTHTEGKLSKPSPAGWHVISFFFSISFCLSFLVGWVFVTVRASSSCGKRGLPSSGGARAAHCRGFSCCQVRAQWLWHMGLVAPWDVESSWTKDWNYVPCIGRWTLNHWTSRRTPGMWFLATC